MKIIFMGNPGFALPCLDQLMESNLNPVAVVTSPPRRAGRGRKITELPVAARTKDLGLQLLQPDSLNDEGFIIELENFEPDLFVVVAFRILPIKCLQIPRFGAINLHASLLPAYRGAAPIQWALINGEEKTGLTTFLLQPEVDTGDILLQEEVPILPGDDTGSLSERMSKIGADLVVKSVSQLESGNLKPVPQDDSLATHAPKIIPSLGEIDWTKPASELHNLVRGLSPRPGAFTSWKGKKLKFFSTQTEDIDTVQPGLIERIGDAGLTVGTGKGKLVVREVQVEGRRRLQVQEFIRGSSIEVGDILGS